MPIYSVVMGQGITVSDLGSDTLATGYGERGDKLQSCSAVILFNTTTHAAGLFHFPARNFSRDGKSQVVVKAMIKAVQPNKAYILFGAGQAASGYYAMDQVNRDLEEYNLALYGGVQGLQPAGCGVEITEPRAGTASISLSSGNVAINEAPAGTVEDLRRYPQAPYDFGEIYWRKRK